MAFGADLGIRWDDPPPVHAVHDLAWCLRCHGPVLVVDGKTVAHVDTTWQGPWP